jgi:hypothetical protein
MTEPAGIDELSIQRLLGTVELITGGRARAKKWLTEPVDSFDGKSALELVAEGRTDDVMRYLSSIESGFVG